MNVEDVLIKYYGGRAEYSGGRLYRIGDKRVEYSGGKLYRVGNDRIVFSGGRLYMVGKPRTIFRGQNIHDRWNKNIICQNLCNVNRYS